MKKAVVDKLADDQLLETLALHFKEDKYKISYAALRWAKEIKKVENLPDAIPVIIPRALREILAGSVSIKDIEKLPMIVKVAPPPPQAAPAAPTIKLNVSSEDESAEA